MAGQGPLVLYGFIRQRQVAQPALLANRFDSEIQQSRQVGSIG